MPASPHHETFSPISSTTMLDEIAASSRSASLRGRPLRLSTRACDRCRRRKAKCDIGPSSERCTSCRISGERCTFDLPVLRRGPKSRRSRAEGSPSISESLHEAVPPPNVPQSGPSGNVPDAPLRTPELALTSPPAWESLLNVDAEPVAQNVRSSVSDPGSAPRAPALHRWHELSRLLVLRRPESNLEQTVKCCFDLFFEYLYPLTPLVHEPSLRDGLAFFVNHAPGHAESTNITETWTGFTQGSPSSAVDSIAHRPGSNILDYASSLKYPELWPDSTFTLITAVCAEAAFLLPKDLFPEGETIADMFLQASRNCLNTYLEADLESPNANSIAIRYFHSNCLHAAGKPKYSWHIFGEATRLAQVMNLHEESSLDGLYPVEAELRRRAFWIVYMGDKSAAILNNRPITIHKFSFEPGITTAYPTGIEDDITVSPGIPGQKTTRRGFIAGFNANLRLWQAASDLLLEFRLLRDTRDRDINALSPQLLTTDEKTRVEALYLRFITCLDDLPPYLQSYTFVASSSKESTQLKQYIIQCANLQVSLHCLRMVVQQKLDELPYFAPGVSQTDLRKTEIARDMLRVINEAPFWALQVNGEPYVEKIRLIGASLLAIIHKNESSPLATRARNDFSVLLDVLTRLDSKASDALRSGSTWTA